MPACACRPLPTLHPPPPPRRGRSLNKCGAISPRFDIASKDIEAWVGRLLPSRQFGHIILTTSQGIMDHDEARCVPLCILVHTRLACLPARHTLVAAALQRGIQQRRVVGEAPCMAAKHRWPAWTPAARSLLPAPAPLAARSRKKVGGKVLGFFY